jgi:uncharacterized membrane protein YkoI
MYSRLAAVSLVAAMAVAPAVFAAPDHSSKNTKKTSKVETQADLQKEAKISDAEARKIALKRIPGTIESGELEREFGKLIYSFDIKVAGKAGITEVAVNAMDGKIVNVARETPKKEAAEKKQEAKEKTNATATTTQH